MGTGSRLVETSLAKLLQVSRTPVREALQKLEHEGLVRRLPQNGFVVEDPRSRHEIVVFRQALEAASIRLACSRASDREIRALQEQADTAIQTVDKLGRMERAAVDRLFHMELARMAHSPRGTNLVEEFYDYSWGQIWLEIPEEVDVRNTIRLFGQHAEIVRALASRDCDLAEAAMRAHLDTVGQVMNAPRLEANPLPKA